MDTIYIDTLKNAFKRIIEKLEFEGVKQIQVPIDMYRKIPTYKWDVSNIEDDEIEIGSLYSDIEAIEALAKDEERLCTYVDFDRVSSLLNIISEIRNPPNG